jgi:hypothetical protein
MVAQLLKSFEFYFCCVKVVSQGVRLIGSHTILVVFYRKYLIFVQ